MATSDSLVLFPLAVMLVIALVTGPLVGGTISFLGYDITFTTFIGLLFVVAAVVIIMGVGIFGSGLAETSITVIFKVLLFGTMWLFLAGVSYGPISDIPLAGTVIWWGMTFVFVIGVTLHVRGYGG